MLGPTEAYRTTLRARPTDCAEPASRLLRRSQRYPATFLWRPKRLKPQETELTPHFSPVGFGIRRFATLAISIRRVQFNAKGSRPAVFAISRSL